MPRKEVKRLVLCKNLVVANDDSIAYLRPSPLQRRVRADLGAADLRRLARRPLLPQGARVAAVHERLDDSILQELALLRVMPERRKRPHHEKELLALRALDDEIDDGAVDKLEKEVAANEHVIQPPQVDGTDQKTIDQQSMGRRDKLRAFVAKHETAMPIEVIVPTDKNDYAVIVIQGVACDKELRDLEKTAVNLNTLHANKGRARTLLRTRTVSQLLCAHGAHDSQKFKVYDAVARRDVLRGRLRVMQAERRGQRALAKEHLQQLEKGWCKGCAAERAVSRTVLLAIFRRFSRIRSYGLNEHCKVLRAERTADGTTFELVYLNAEGRCCRFRMGSWLDRLNFDTHKLEGKSEEIAAYVQRMHDIYHEELALVLMDEQQITKEEAEALAQSVYLEQVASNIIDERLRGLMAHVDPPKTDPDWEALATCNPNISNPYAGGELALLNGLLFVDYKEADFIMLRGSSMHAVVPMRECAASAPSAPSTPRAQFCRHSAVFFSRAGFRMRKLEEVQVLGSSRSETRRLQQAASGA